MNLTKTVLSLILMIVLGHCGNVVVGNGNRVKGDGNYIDHGDGNTIHGDDNSLR
jgi:hypothetical protein